MPNKITYTIKTADGKEHQVSKENIDKHGIQSYADAYEGATIRMRDSKKGDYDIPLSNYNDAKAQGLHAFSWEHKPVVAQNNPQATQKQPAPKVNTTPGTPMTAAQKAQVLNNTSGIVDQSQSDLSRTMRKIDYAKQNTGLDVKPIKLGENRNVATKKNKNGQTTYLDAEGNRFDDHAQANFSQTQIEEDEAKRKDLLGYIDKKAMSSVNSAYDKQYSELEDFKKKHPYLSAFSRALSAFSGRMSGGGTANINQYRPEEARTGLAALAFNQKTRQAIDEGKRYEQGDTGFRGRSTRGLKKGLTSASTYDFGISDTDIAGSLKEAADRYAKGQATQMDELLLDAAALNSETEAKYADALGGWFGAGEAIPGVASFMMQIGSNPMSGFGKATAQSVAKTVIKRAVQKFGTGLAAKAAITLAKGATRVAADAVEAGVVTAMYSPTKIVGDYLNRKTGTVVHDGNGGYTFEGKEYSNIKAVAKAINDQNAENLSEMWGDYLPGIGKVGKLIGKGARKIGLGKVVNAFEQMSSSQWMKTWNEFMDRTKWNGLSGEYMEEAEKNLYNALTNGDMTLDTNPNTGVFSRKINEDTFKSVALMSGIMSGISTVGYTRFKYKASRGQKKADNNAKAVLGAEKWSEIKKLIDNADDKSIGGIIEQIGNDNSLNTKQKMAILDYQYKSAVAHGANIQDLKNKLEGNYDEKANRYDAGYNATENKLANIKNELELRHRQLAETFKDDPSALQKIEEDPKAFLQGLKESEVGGKKAKVINAYEETRAAYDGMIQRVKDNIDDAITENNTVIEQRTHQDGNIYSATMKLDDRKVYVVGGNVQMNEDGKGIDHEKSSSSVMIRDAETGKIEMVDPFAILSVDTPVNAEEEKATSSEQIKQTYAQEQANKIDGVLEFKAGDTYSILDEDQNQHTIQIIGEAIDEKTKQPNPDMVMASIDGLEPTMLPKEQIQAMNDEENLWRLDQSLKQGEEVENTTPHSAQSYHLNDEITLINEDGKPVRGSITTDQNEDGKFEVYTEEPINGKRVNLLTAEELDAMHAQIQGEQGEQIESPALVAENATTQKENVAGLNDGTIAENTTVQKEAEIPHHQPTALERIPTNEQGEPIYEQVDPETAWDAIVEQTEGDESIAQSVADGMVADMEAVVKRAEKAKVKGGTTIAEKIAAEKERVANIEQAKATLEHWKKIASTNSRRQEAIQAEESRKAKEAALLRKEQEERERAMREEEERVKREALNGVPDMVEDKATDARARGYRRVNGDKVDRQEPLNAIKGKEVQVKFDDKNIPTGHVSLIDVDELQPSHKNGHRNPLHFIDEAQPKERKDDASIDAARKIAANIRPEEITSSVTAYTGAPTVNSRGEVIQGNNRSAALKEMWAMHKEQGDKYKQYLIDHAEELGLNPDDVRSMRHPVLVNMLDVNDNDAISLGQFVASDTESGGTERIKPKNVVKKLGNRMKTFANILLRTTDEDMSFAELIDRNGVEALKWMSANGSITSTQYKSAFDSKGNLTAEAKNDLKGVMYQSIFEGGSTQLEEMFNALPIKAQKAILATAYRDYDSPTIERMVEEIQNSIMAYYALSLDEQFKAATNHKSARFAVESWKRQYAIDDSTGESYLPSEKYSNFALLLATIYKGDSQSFIQGTFKQMYDLIQGTQEDNLFEQPDNTPRTLVEAIKETLNIEYDGQQRSDILASNSTTSQQGEQRSNGNSKTGGRSETRNGSEDYQRGTQGDSGRSRSEQSSGDSQEEVTKRNSHLTEKEALILINLMETNAIDDPQIALTPGSWLQTFGINNSIDTPIGKVKMGENQYAKLQNKNRSAEFGMISLTLSDPDVIFIEPSEANIEKETERPYSYVFAKTFKRGGENLKFFTSVTVSIDGLEISVSSHIANTNNIKKKLMEFDREYTKKTLFPNSSEMHLTEHQSDVPDLLPTQGNNVSSAGKVSETSNAVQENAEKSSENEATRVETNPTEAQKEAGNYKKGHIKVDGMNITIEQPKGSIRRGKDASGKEWESEMHNTYGYIRGTEGVDGDHIDIFLSDNPNEGNVFVVDQVNKDGSFDEHKVMYGFADKESARQAYLSNYEDGWQGLGNITEVSKEEFKKWIDSSKRKTKSFAEYKGIIKSNKGVSSAVAMSEDEYLVSKGLNGNMTDYMLDKLRIPHSETARQQKQREKEAARVRADFDNQKEEARKEYRQKIAKGELRQPTKQEAKEREIAKLIKTANGHEDNPSVQAARRSLAKRGVDWRTDKGDTSDNDLADKKELEDFERVEKKIMPGLNNDLTRLRLRALKEGELSHVERRYIENKGFSFVGNERIESIEDVAYIFKQLETSSVENSFIALIKDGKPTILHLSIGGYTMTAAPIEQAIVAVEAIKPDKVVFVHNHPSGNIKASKADLEVQRKMKATFGDKAMPAIIINTTSGKFGTFSENGNLEDGKMPQSKEQGNIPVKVYNFSQQVFAKDWNPDTAFKVFSSESIAAYVSSHRLGEHKKMSLLILNHAGHVTGNVFLPWTTLKDAEKHENVLQIASYVNQMGGTAAVIYGNYKIGKDIIDTNESIRSINKQLSDSGLYLMDVINITDSAHDRGVMEEKISYGSSKVSQESNIQNTTRDAEYIKAVENNDTETIQRLLSEEAERKGYSNDSSYQGSLAFNGAAPSQNAYFETKEERKEAWENDEYEDTMSLGDYVDSGIDTNNLEWNLTDPMALRQADPERREAIENLRQTVRSNSKTITIYRGVDANIKENEIRNGDWVTPSRSYAEYHIGLQDWENGRVIEQEVSIDDLWWDGNDIAEWGYDNGKGEVYKNTPNNRKMFEVTYDDKGNIIPLSERFNEDNDDIRYRHDDKVENESNSSEDNEAKTFAEEHNLNVADVIAYKKAMDEGLLRDANKALSEIRRKLREENKGLSLSGFVKKFSPIREALYKQFGDLGVLEKEYHDSILKERGLMEAARKREEEERKRQNKPIEELMSMTSEERDAEYMRALEAKDEKRMSEVLQAEAKLKGYSMGAEYQGEGDWKAPSNPGYSSTEERRAALEKEAPHLNIDDIANGYINHPGDIFTDLHAYGNDNESGKESAKAISDAISDIKDGKGMPKVTVYRAVPTSVEEESLRNGDWVTPSQAYAKEHGEHRLDGDYRIIEQKVPANELWWDGNDIREWGFDNGKDYAYKNTENSRKLNDLITRDDQGNVILPSQRFNDQVEDERFRNDEELEKVNQRFNEELENLTEENADKITLWLGNPSDVLLSSGIENKPLKLYGNKVIKKMKKHGFALDELRDLPKAVADPIAVFDNLGRLGNRSILTELTTEQGNFLVTIDMGKGEKDVDFNIVSSVFDKGESKIVSWIERGLTAYINKKKALNYLHHSAPIAEALSNSRLSSVANIVKSFENPTNSSEKVLDRKTTQAKEVAEKERQQMVERASELAKTLHLDNVEIVTNASTLEGKKAKAKGFYSTSTGKITIVIPNHSNIADVEKTLLHEAVAHHGLRKLFGEHFDNFLDNVFKNASEDVRREIVKLAAKNKWDFRIATEEYLASLAEDTNFEKMPNELWDKVKRLFLDMLRSIGLLKQKDEELNDNELRYILWRSYKNLKEKGQSNSILNKAEDIAMQHRLKVGNYAPQEEGKAKVSEKPHKTEKVDNNTIFYRKDEPEVTARTIYEDAVKDTGKMSMLSALAHTYSKEGRERFKHKFSESYFDYSRSIKQLQDAISKASGRKLEEFEEVWKSLNAKSSIDSEEINLAMLRYISPLSIHIAEMIRGVKMDGQQLTLDDVEVYMNALHGIERNAYMANSELKSLVNKNLEKWKEHRLKKLRNSGISKEEALSVIATEEADKRDEITQLNMGKTRKDYSGLTALFSDENTNNIDVAILEERAQKYVNAFEKTVGKDKVDEMWKKVKNLNDFSIRKAYLSGLINKKHYDEIKNMYEHYVPLRGWHDDYAGDIFEYVNAGQSMDALQGVVKKAYGRTTRAGNILGTMASMANTAIVQGNKNLVAQKFLNLALNYGNKSGLLMVSKQWYEETASGELVPLYPSLKEGMSAAEMQQHIEEFEAEMEEAKKSGTKKIYTRSFGDNMPQNFQQWQEKQHSIRALRNGVEHTIYVLGNPKAAQAFNGLLTPVSQVGAAQDIIMKVMRFQAMMQTSLSPEFVISNFQRDVLTAATGTYIKYGWGAGKDFASNLTKVMPVSGLQEGNPFGIYNLIHKYNKGTLDKTNDIERMFDEFVRKGGMTGISSITRAEEFEKQMEKSVKRIKRGKLNVPQQLWEDLADGIEFMNKGIENATRFAAYMTSRKMGKNVTDSIFDAKECSVNFNMKGSGAWGNLWMRRYILYANPALQSLRMLGTWYEASPKRFMGVFSTVLTASILTAMLGYACGGDDGDDNDWYKLNEFNRYNYISVKAGNGFVHWSLSQEIRPVWALGQIIFDWSNSRVSAPIAINSMATQLNNLSPMAFFSGGSDNDDSFWKTAVKAWTPTVVADFMDAYAWNENFLGKNITYRNDWNKEAPEWRKAGKDTPKWAVNLSRAWNKATGGADNRKSWWDSPALNPSAVYYIMSSQFGGMGTLATKLSRAFEQWQDPEQEVEARNIPFVSKFWVTVGDDYSKNRVLNEEFKSIWNEWKLTDYEIKHNKSDLEKGLITDEEYANLEADKKYLANKIRYEALEDLMKDYNTLMRKRNDENDNPLLDEEILELKKKVVERAKMLDK